MATPAEQALSDVEAKIEEENRFRPELAAAMTLFVRRFVKNHSEGGPALDPRAEDEDLATLLNSHYGSVSAAFRGRVDGQLPEDLRASQSENRVVDEALLAALLARADRQARLINDTNAADANTALEQASQIVQADPSAPADRTTIAVTAGAILSRRLRGRLESRVNVETQDVAEMVKTTEAQVLAGVQPPEGGAPAVPVETGPSKTWFTVGDERVRPAHVAADGQTVPVGEAFLVGGQQLRWPGDTGLGATLDNVMGCRCSSVHDTDELIAVRRRPGFIPLGQL